MEATPTPDQTSAQSSATVTELRVRSVPPTWTGALPLLLHAYEHGNDTARDQVTRELYRLAAVADLGNQAFATLARLAEGEEPSVASDEIAQQASVDELLRRVEALNSASDH